MGHLQVICERNTAKVLYVLYNTPPGFVQNFAPNPGGFSASYGAKRRCWGGDQAERVTCE
jgi:hypothetical protein